MIVFRLLGEIELCVAERPVPVRGARQQGLLAALLVEAGQPVTSDQLLERAWGTHRRPTRPTVAVRTQLTLLRRVLTPATGLTITWQPTGYRLIVDEDTVDVHQFRRLVREAHAAADDDQMVTGLERALGLWRGEAFATLDTPWLVAQRGTLDSERHAARLDLVDARLRRGQHTMLLPELSERTEAHPWDERVTGQLMLALYRSGRRADALDHYQRMRHRLADQLGTDPSPPLHQLHQQILTADPALLPTAPAVVRPSAVPRQLPAPPAWFTGRATELTTLTGLLEQPGNPVAVVSAIGGAGGIGKTCLALHWAHQHLDRFPDGQLYVNLRGFDPAGHPVLPEAALRGFLAALGAPPPAGPADLDALAAHYRSLVAGKRMFILLDDAHDVAQVEPLLPGSASCTVLVTSRRYLAGLAATRGAVLVNLDVLPEAEAREVLARHLWPDRLAAEPDTVAELVALCGGLPLALTIVTARARQYPDFPLAVLAAELREESQRLDALDAGDLHANLRAVLSCSYRALGPDAAQVFRLLGLVPDLDISLPAAASLAALPTARVRVLLRELEHLSLLTQHQPGRYRMHDLVHLYATEQADQELSEDARAAALERLVDFYVQTAYAGDRRMEPHRKPIEQTPPVADSHPHPLADAAAAMRWFTAEHATLLAAQQIAATHGWHTATWHLAWALNTFHLRQSNVHDQIACWHLGLAAAESLDDRAVQALAHRRLGRAYGRARRVTESVDHLNQALTIAEDIGDVRAQADTHYVLTMGQHRSDDPRPGLAHATQAWNLYRTLGDAVWEAVALSEIGFCQARLGQYDQARDSCEQALTAARQQQHRQNEASTLEYLGIIAHLAGEHSRAIDHYHQSLIVWREIGNPSEEVEILDHLGEAHADCGQYSEARYAWQEALELCRSQHRLTDAERIQHQLDDLDDPPTGSRHPAAGLPRQDRASDRSGRR